MERDNTHSAPLKVPVYRVRISPSTHVSITLSSFAPFSPAPIDEILISKAANMASLVRTSSHGSQTPILDDHRASTNTFGYREGENLDQYEIRSLDKIREDLSKLQVGSTAEFDTVKKDIKAVNSRFDTVQNDIEAVKSDLNSRFDTVQNDIEAVKSDLNSRFDTVQNDIKAVKKDMDAQGKKHMEMLVLQQKVLLRLAENAGIDTSEDYKALQAAGSIVALPEVVVTHTPTSSVSSREPQFRASTPPSFSGAGPSTLPDPFPQIAPSSRLSKKHSFLSLPHLARLRAQSEPDVREALKVREVHETFRLLEADHQPEVKKGLHDVIRAFKRAFSNK